MIKAVIFDFGNVMISLRALSFEDDITTGLADGRIFAYGNMFALVDDLKKRGYRTYVLSNTIPEHAEIIRSKGWFEPFDDIFLSYEIGLRKPQKEFYELVLKKIGRVPNEALFIDDVAENLAPAAELGMKTVLAESSEQVVRDIRELLTLD